MAFAYVNAASETVCLHKDVIMHFKRSFRQMNGLGVSSRKGETEKLWLTEDYCH